MDEPYRCLSKNMARLNKLLKLIESLPDWNALLDEVKQSNNKTIICLNSARPYILTALYENLQKPVLLVTAQPENAKKFQEQLTSWYSEKEIYLFPELDILPYERLTPDTSTEIDRIKVLSMLVEYDESIERTQPPLVVTSAAALMSRTTAYKDFKDSQRTVKQGMNIEPFHLLEDFQKMGYWLENIVEIPGMMSHRGGIIDIYPPTTENPIRLEFFGDTIDSIRTFDPATQRSIDKIEEIRIGPAAELLLPRLMNKQALGDILDGIDLTGCSSEVKEQFQRDKEAFITGQTLRDAQFYAPLFNKGKILDYLPSDTLIVLDEPASIEQAAIELDAEAAQLRSEKLERGELPRNFPTPYFTWEELEPGLKNSQSLSLEAWGVEEDWTFFPRPTMPVNFLYLLTKTDRASGATETHYHRQPSG